MLQLLEFGLIIAARILWQRRPNVGTCALFWTIALVTDLIGWTFAPSELLLAAGVLSNAAVTLANGGYMPVAAQRRSDMRARSLWVRRTDSQHLLFLADNFGNRFIRFSIGDALLVGGIILGSFGY